MNNLRVGYCEDNDVAVVQVWDGGAWMCCHNNNEMEVYEEDLQRDVLDVKELIRDPTGKSCNWCNPYLRVLQAENNNYYD